MPFLDFRNTMLDSRRISSFRSFVNDNAKLYGELPVYVYKRNHVERSISYSDMKGNVDAFGTSLLAYGLAGTNIAVIGEAAPEYMTAIYAIVIAGGTAVPLDKELGDDSIVDFINFADVKAVVYMPGQSSRIKGIMGRLPDVRYFIPVTDPSPSCDSTDKRTLSFSKFLDEGYKRIKRGDHSFYKIPTDTSKTALLLFTSGTTGTSKGVMLSQKNLCAATYAACDSMDHFTAGVKLISVLPMNHTYELTCSHLASQYFGTVTLLNDSLKYFSRNLQSFKPDALILVPLFVETLHKRIWDEIRSSRLEKPIKAAMYLTGKLSKLGFDVRDHIFSDIRKAFGGEIRTIICGGAPLGANLVKDFCALGINIQEGYGITECSPLVAVNRLGRERPGSCGQPVFNCKVCIDSENGWDNTGEILVSGPNVMQGYYKDEAATNAVFTVNGYFRTGDIGYCDSENYIYITGRKKNVIILSNGKNVFPEEIEGYLKRCPLIRESVVLGRENMQGEVVITALIYPDYDRLAHTDSDRVYELIKSEVTEINTHLPNFKKIRNIELRTTEFEKTSTQKIQRYKINNRNG